MVVGLGVGSVFAGYRVERVLGAGGMGTVYLARNPDLPRFEAIKVLSAELSRDADFRARFVREADVAAGLDHPNVVAIYRRGEFEGQLWIAMQFVDGTDADEALRAGAMTPVRAVHVVSEVAKALDYAHERKVVHRDVKPGNFLLSGPVGPEERVLLGDFGIARALDDAKLTATGSFMATVSYAAPEVLAGESFDGRADVYSLGCTLFRLLSGVPPFASANGMAAVIAAHLTAPPPRVSDVVPALSMRMDEVIAKAMAKDPAARFVSARKFAAAAAQALGAEDTTVALRAVPGVAVAPYAPAPTAAATAGWAPQQVGPPPWAPPPGPFAPPRRPRGRWLAAATALLVVAATAIGVTLLARSGRHATPATATPTSSTTPPTVGASALLGLILPAQQAADIIGAPKMVVTRSLGQVADDSGAETLFGKDVDCVGAFLPAQHSTYANTGWTAARVQDLSDGNATPMYAVYQAVITFRSADAARKAFSDQVLPQWSKCSGRTISVTIPGLPPQRTTFGPLNDANGIVSMAQTKDDINGWRCQRAITTRSNVVIDVNACRADLANQGIDVLNAIAAKIPQ
ncbi:hypothetical protein A5791_10220 [Mycobacterium sp. 852002-51163_SCH5372311]|uniref:serine/threonine-protein kinase PknH/PknJ n=1 Tax=Mycobacterium sp. 852002-51163_SCH5372311 TaxID=1834097 RepID=UPI0007FD278E|nr:serine/threonine-protein kinase PknH/PknJ [Mycobacterium sp. 852002-51163_SCH5372311]OBF79906.1 hypothetical protein A5791_10220 [Mycobacterium sp. 852002-51163_SCH5372311]